MQLRAPSGLPAARSSAQQRRAAAPAAVPARPNVTAAIGASSAARPRPPRRAALGVASAVASGRRPDSPPVAGYYYRDPSPWPTDIQLPPHDLEREQRVDLVVAGAWVGRRSVRDGAAPAAAATRTLPSPPPVAPLRFQRCQLRRTAT